MGNIESKVRSAAEVRMRFFGATFFLEVEVEAEVISIKGLSLCVRYGLSRNITHEYCVPAMNLVPCPESCRID